MNSSLTTKLSSNNTKSWELRHNYSILFNQTFSLSLIPSGLIESRKINRLPYTPGIHKSYFVRFQLTITDNCCLGEKSLIYLLVDFCFSYKFNPRFSIEYLIGPTYLEIMEYCSTMARTIHSKITMTHNAVPCCTVTALVPTALHISSGAASLK